jgi:chemotaxis protein histidine kinase CheA
MGLGLFLARAVIEGVGGTLDIDSVAGEGTRVHVRLPVDVGAGSPAVLAVRSREPNPVVVVSKPA